MAIENTNEIVVSMTFATASSRTATDPKYVLFKARLLTDSCGM